MLVWFPRSALRLSLATVLVGISLAACSSPEQKAQSYYARGQEFLKKKDYVKASLEFKNALQLKKNMLEAWRGLLDVEMHSGNSQVLVPVLSNIVELDPRDVDAKLRLGRLLLAGNAVDQALDLANKATEFEPKNPAAVAFRAAVMLKLDNATAAKHEAQEALDLDPKNADALIVLAAERVRQNDLNGALAILNTEAVVHDNDLAIQLFKLAV